MRRRLRNLLAEWCLAALRDAQAPARLQALAAFAKRADEAGQAEGMTSEQAGLLASTECFAVNGVAVCLAPDLMRDLPVLRLRARLLVEATAKSQARCGSSAALDAGGSWSLCAAAVLFNAGLFFEAHELLERAWRDAADDLKSLLQGLIQVAVGLQHQADGNVRGALRLLAAGNEKLRRFRPAARGVALESFCADVERIVERLRATPGAPIETPRLVVAQAPSESTR